MTKILFLDLDGTVRRTISGQTFINDPNDQELIPGVADTLNNYLSWVVAGVTNQAGVAVKKKTLESCIEEQKITLLQVPQMHSISFCIDFEGNQAYRLYRDGTLKQLPYGRNYRKPAPGMLSQFIEDFICPVMLDDLLMVGDRIEDKQCAIASGIDFIWAEEWRNG